MKKKSKNKKNAWGLPWASPAFFLFFVFFSKFWIFFLDFSFNFPLFFLIFPIFSYIFNGFLVPPGAPLWDFGLLALYGAHPGPLGINQGRNIWDDPIIEKSQDQDLKQWTLVFTPRNFREKSKKITTISG